LLAADDRGQTGKAGVTPPQRRHARQFKYGFEPRVLLKQRVDGAFEVGLGVEVEDHPGIFFAVAGHVSLACTDCVYMSAFPDVLSAHGGEVMTADKLEE
jgi:hypothetical protein